MQVAQFCLSIYNTQRSTKINLGRIGDGTNEAIDFHNTSKELGAGALPNDGSPLRVGFDVPSGTQRTMLLTDFEKQKTVTIANTSVATIAGKPLPSAAGGNNSGSSPPRIAGLDESHRVLLAGTLLELQFATPVSVEQVGSGKLFPATIVRTRSSAITGRGRENLPEGTTVFVRITPGNGRQFLIEADHAVIHGATVVLNTNAHIRVPMRSAARSAPIQESGTSLLVPEGTMINLTTKSDSAFNAAP